MENSAAQQHGQVKVQPKPDKGSLPAKKNPVSRVFSFLKGATKQIFGQFLSAQFWVDMAQIAAAEMARSFLKTVGGTIKWYGENKIKTPATDAVNQQQQQSYESSSASQAFSRGYNPQSSYQSSYQRPYQPTQTYASSSSPSDASWPGFGPRG